MREKLNLFLVWEWKLVSENSRFSPLSFGVSFSSGYSQMLMKCLLRVMGILSVWSMPIQMTLRSKNIFMGLGESSLFP